MLSSILCRGSGTGGAYTWNLWGSVLVGSPELCPLFALVVAVLVVECAPGLGLVASVSGASVNLRTISCH